MQYMAVVIRKSWQTLDAEIVIFVLAELQECAYDRYTGCVWCVYNKFSLQPFSRENLDIMHDTKGTILFHEIFS